MCNQKQRRYRDSDIFPNIEDCPTDCFNLWMPFVAESITIDEPDMKALQIVKNHIHLMAGGNDDIYQFLIQWIAQSIQYPHIKNGVCPTIISKQGAGKGSFIKLLYKMLGSKKILETTEPSRDVWGNHNALMESAYIVNLNELSKKDTMEAEGKIKGLFTDSSITINQKGINQYKVKSFHRFIITTNKEEPINVSTDDRRNFVIRASDEMIGNKEYFTQLNELLDNPTTIKTCYEFFKSVPDVINFHKFIIPKTEYNKDLQVMTISPIE